MGAEKLLAMSGFCVFEKLYTPVCHVQAKVLEGAVRMINLLVAACALSGFLSSPAPLTLPLPKGAPFARISNSADIPLKTPTGWKANTGQGATVMTPGDLAEGKVYTVLVTPLQIKAGSLDEVYAASKALMGEVGAFTPLTKPQQAQSDGGWDYKVTIGALEKSGKALLAQIVALKKGELGGIVSVNSGAPTTPIEQRLRPSNCA